MLKLFLITFIPSSIIYLFIGQEVRTQHSGAEHSFSILSLIFYFVFLDKCDMWFGVGFFGSYNVNEDNFNALINGIRMKSILMNYAKEFKREIKLHAILHEARL